MNAVDLIAKKRDGGELNDEEIKFIVEGYTRGSIPDYQASAWCMAMFFQGMNHAEVTALTLHMAHSGDMLDLHTIAPFVVDKTREIEIVNTAKRELEDLRARFSEMARGLDPVLRLKRMRGFETPQIQFWP